MSGEMILLFLYILAGIVFYVYMENKPESRKIFEEMHKNLKIPKVKLFLVVVLGWIFIFPFVVLIEKQDLD